MHELTTHPADPHVLFRAWYEDAERCDAIRYAHAMCLSTVDAEGLPDARTVLLKHFDDAGFVFFTDARSPKARQLEGRPAAALTFYWGPLERQVRLRGEVAPAGDERSDACFAHRPRESRITAWASRQSEPLARRGELEERVESHTKEFENEDAVPRPPHWRAYRLTARIVEFWQARAGRLHDRLLYVRDGGGWRISWLEP